MHVANQLLAAFLLLGIASGPAAFAAQAWGPALGEDGLGRPEFAPSFSFFELRN